MSDRVIRTVPGVPDQVVGTVPGVSNRVLDAVLDMPDRVIRTVPDMPDRVIRAVTGDGCAGEAGQQHSGRTSTQQASHYRAGSQRLHSVALGPSHRLGPSCLRFVRSLR
jgi:hypothetical protein